MKLIIQITLSLIFIYSCKNQTTYTENTSQKNQVGTSFIIDSTNYPIDSLQLLTEYSNKFKKEVFKLKVFTTSAIRKEKPNSKIDYSYIEVNCELANGEYYFTELGEEKLPYMYAIIKHIEGVSQTNSHRIDKEGKYNKVIIKNIDSLKKTFDIEFFLHFRINGITQKKTIFKGVNLKY